MYKFQLKRTYSMYKFRLKRTSGTTVPQGPRMAQNHQNGSKCYCMTPNDPKTLQVGILHDYMSCWTTLGPFQGPTGAP